MTTDDVKPGTFLTLGKIRPELFVENNFVGHCFK